MCLSIQADAQVFISGNLSFRFDACISVGGMHLVFERCRPASPAHLGSGDPAGSAPGTGERLWSHARRSFCQLFRYDINKQTPCGVTDIPYMCLMHAFMLLDF